MTIPYYYTPNHPIPLATVGGADGQTEVKLKKVDFFSDAFQSEYKRKLRQLAFNLRKNVYLLGERFPKVGINYSSFLSAGNFFFFFPPSQSLLPAESFLPGPQCGAF